LAFDQEPDGPCAENARQKKVGPKSGPTIKEKLSNRWSRWASRQMAPGRRGRIAANIAKLPEQLKMASTVAARLRDRGAACLAV